ncbi:reverse transcriptase [Phytophthora cinnamomi]|uniref:reverse transcriptase n=1 Tax=Phytophthora cinnamomi TaxID=4785 RepID=UPI00355A022F|nr:reverse transcriptase [Phytophthora cinnamomi]
MAGAGALLYNSQGTATWTDSVHLAGVQRNNTTEYQALLARVEAAVAHGCRVLRIEGDSALVIAQVKGEFPCSNTRLRGYRNRIRRGRTAVGRTTLVHIDRMNNQVTDRLTNRALERHCSRFECADYGTRTTACPTTAQPPPTATTSQSQTAPSAPTPQSPQLPRQDHSLPDAPVDAAEGFPVIATGPDAVPEARPRLRLRKLTEGETTKATKQMELLARRLQTRLREAPSSAEDEGLLCTIAPAIYDALLPFALPARYRERRPRSPRSRSEPSSTNDMPGASTTKNAWTSCTQCSGTQCSGFEVG